MLIKIIGVCLCGVVINIVLKQYKPEFAMLANVCCGLIVFALIVDGVKDIIENIIEVSGKSELKIDVISPILKVIGIGYITEWTSDLAEESGNKSISGKIIMGGKIAICIIAMPIIKDLFLTILSIV